MGVEACGVDDDDGDGGRENEELLRLEECEGENVLFSDSEGAEVASGVGAGVGLAVGGIISGI